MPLLCAHCGSAAGSTARLEGDLDGRRVFVCIRCQKTTSPVGCMERVKGEHGLEDICGGHAVAWCSVCSPGRKAVCSGHLAQRKSHRSAVRCRPCASRMRRAELRRAVRVLPHPRELWYSGVN